MTARGVLLLVTLAGLCATGRGADLQPSPTAEVLKHGAQTVVQLCSLCHNLKYVHYRELGALGLTSEEVDRLRGSHGLDDFIMSANTSTQARALFGTLPPELSLLAKAYDDEDHIYRFLTAFKKDPSGKIDNSLRPGTAMPDVLAYTEKRSPERRAQTELRAREVAEFLKWAADPRAHDRIRLGRFVMGYLVVLTALLYLLKRMTWRRLDARRS